MRMSSDYEEIWRSEGKNSEFQLEWHPGFLHEICRILILGPPFLCPLVCQIHELRWRKDREFQSSWIQAAGFMPAFCDLPLRFVGLDDYSDAYILDIHRSLLKRSVSVSRGKTRRWRFPGSWNEHGKLAPLGAIRVQKKWGLTVGKVTFWHWYLVGGFKYFLFSALLFREDFQFD